MKNMKKLLLLGGLTLCLGATKAQKNMVYDNFENIRGLHYYSSLQYPVTFGNPTNVKVGTTITRKDGLNKSDSVAKYVKTANGSDAKPAPYAFISCATVIPNSGEWGSFDMSTYPVVSIDVFAHDTMTVRILFKDKTVGAEKDIKAYDIKYAAGDTGKWRRLIADFTTTGDYPVKNELQFYFSYAAARNFTAYFDNVMGSATVKDVPLSVKNIVASNFEMLQNVPNPASDVTHIAYSLQNSEKVSVKVYDILGNCVSTLVNEKQSAGKYSISYDVSTLQNGIYYSTMQVGEYTQTKKLQVIH